MSSPVRLALLVGDLRDIESRLSADDADVR